MQLSLVVVVALGIVAVCVANDVSSGESTETDKRFVPGRCTNSYSSSSSRNRLFGRYQTRHLPKVRAAFMAFHTLNTGNLFMGVQLDTRNLYEVATSTFHVEDAGFYAFTLFLKSVSYYPVALNLLVDDQPVLNVQGSGSSNGYGQIIVHLNQGQRVKAGLADGDGHQILLGTKSAFGGYQLDQYMNHDH